MVFHHASPNSVASEVTSRMVWHARCSRWRSLRARELGSSLGTYCLYSPECVGPEFSEVPEETFIVDSSSPFRVHTGRGTTKLPLSTFPTPPLELMHPTSEKRNSRKFAQQPQSYAAWVSYAQIKLSPLRTGFHLAPVLR